MWVAAAGVAGPGGWLVGGGMWRGSWCACPHSTFCLGVSPGHVPGGMVQAGTSGGVLLPHQSLGWTQDTPFLAVGLLAAVV